MTKGSGRFVSVPALWDNYNNYLNNSIINVDSTSFPIGIVSMQPYPTPPNAPVTPVNVLQIKTPDLTVLFLPITLAQWQELVRNSEQVADGPTTFTYVAGTDFPAGADYAVLPVLMNSKIVAVSLNGAVQYSPSNYNYDGLETITFGGQPFNDGDILQITLYYP